MFLEFLTRKLIMLLVRLLLLAFAVSAAASLAATLPPIESMPTVDAATLLPVQVLDGSAYSVERRVPVVGYMGQFT